MPKPGAIRDLLALISILHGGLLDRSRPLWEFYFIEGITGGRFAVYSKFHHALMDGVSAVQVIRRSLQRTAEAGEFQVPWQLDTAEETGHPPAGAWSLLCAGMRQGAALPGAGWELYRSWQDAGDPDFTTITQAPRTLLNRRISGSRRFAAQSYSLSRIKRLARHYQATINDLVLALCAGALRRYLIELDALPDAPLVAMVPVSLHSSDTEHIGNQVALILTSLATDIADPVARLAAIQRSVNYWKRRYQQMSNERLMALAAALSAPAGINLLTGIAPKRQSFNVIISNIPGPRETLYLDAAELTGMYPVSLVLDGQALNISLVSYRDSLEFGLLACRRLLPSMQHLLGYLADALDELEPADNHPAKGDGAAAPDI